MPAFYSLLLAFVLLGGLCTQPAAWAQTQPLPATAEQVEGAAEAPQLSEAEAKQVEARKHYNEGIRLFRSAQLEKQRQNERGYKRLWKQAKKQYEKALKLDETLVQAQSNLAYLYLDRQDFRRAENAFEEALELNPQHLNSLNGLATVQALNKEPEAAIATFETLLGLAPGDAKAHFNYGSTLHQFGKTAEAEQAYLRALELDPSLLEAAFNLATLYENQGQPEKAKPYYKQVKRAALETPMGLEALNRLGALSQ